MRLAVKFLSTQALWTLPLVALMPAILALTGSEPLSAMRLLAGATAVALVVSAGIRLGEGIAPLTMAFITGAGGVLAWRFLSANRTSSSH